MVSLLFRECLEMNPEALIQKRFQNHDFESALASENKKAL
jgi:hypothetical protein